MGSDFLVIGFYTDHSTPGDCYSAVDLSPCTRLEEVRFFVGMVPVGEFPLDGIHDSLESISSRDVRMITLDLNAIDAAGTSQPVFLRSFRRLDSKLCKIASDYLGAGSTVVRLSASNPHALGLCLRRFEESGKLVLGTRYRDSLEVGDVQWYDM